MMEEHFTGRSVGLQTAIQTAQKIVIGRLAHLGAASPGAPGEAYYDDGGLAVIRWLRSDVPEDLRKSSLAFACTVQTLPASIAERTPVAGQAYLFFMAVRTDGSLRAIKILSADDPRVGEVERALTGQRQ